MGNSIFKPRKHIKPLLIALIFISLIAIILFSKQDQKQVISSLNLPETKYYRSIFVSANQKSGIELPEFIFVQDNSLKPNIPPFVITPQILGALMGGVTIEDTDKIIAEYAVEDGDNLWAIAAKFDISVNTILWANNLTKTVIRPGQKLTIPPVTGVIHHVKDGDTIGSIAKKYKADTEDIISFNYLSGEGDIFVGDILMVPDGEITVTTSRVVSSQVPLGNSYFICPISQPCRITQGLHWYNAVDFGHGKCYDPIYAAAGGTVQKVKLTNSTSRWAYGGAGNNITVLHPNGVVTMYGHLATSFVNPGDNVYQGQQIALMGGQPGTAGAGQSTACHVHFGVSGARNPFAY